MVRDGKRFHVEKKEKSCVYGRHLASGCKEAQNEQGEALYWLTAYNGLLAAWRGQDGGDGEIGVGGGVCGGI